MAELKDTVLFVVFGCLAVLMAISLFKAIGEGPTEIRRIRRRGFGILALLRGRLVKTEVGSTINVMEGLECLADGNTIRKAAQTRTISNEIS